jgi:hypothetical protein
VYITETQHYHPYYKNKMNINGNVVLVVIVVSMWTNQQAVAAAIVVTSSDDTMNGTKTNAIYSTNK